MDLGIRGKKAIVCASSKGLGRGCAMALAEAGCDLVVNGRNAELVAKTAAELRERYGVKVIEIVGDVSKPEVQKAMLAACPDPDILVNNNGGPPLRDFRELDRAKILEGVTRTVIDRNVTITSLLPGKLDTDRLRGPHEAGTTEDPAAAAARKTRISADVPAKRLGTPEELGQICAFLCSVHAGYLTGQNIPVDGGLYVSAF